MSSIRCASTVFTARPMPMSRGGGAASRTAAVRHEPHHPAPGQRRKRCGRTERQERRYLARMTPLEGLMMGTRCGDIDRRCRSTSCAGPACRRTRSRTC